MSTITHPTPGTDSQPPVSPVAAHRSPVESGTKHGKATTAMVLGILACVAFIIPIAAWILGGIALGFALTARNQLRYNPEAGMARANAGLVLSIIALVLGTAMAALNVAMMV